MFVESLILSAIDRDLQDWDCCFILWFVWTSVWTCWDEFDWRVHVPLMRWVMSMLGVFQLRLIRKDHQMTMMRIVGMYYASVLLFSCCHVPIDKGSSASSPSIAQVSKCEIPCSSSSLTLASPMMYVTVPIQIIHPRRLTTNSQHVHLSVSWRSHARYNLYVKSSCMDSQKTWVPVAEKQPGKKLQTKTKHDQHGHIEVPRYLGEKVKHARSTPLHSTVLLKENSDYPLNLSSRMPKHDIRFKRRSNWSCQMDSIAPIAPSSSKQSSKNHPFTALLKIALLSRPPETITHCCTSISSSRTSLRLCTPCLVCHTCATLFSCQRIHSHDVASA